MQKLRFEVLFCDDIRHEANGKHILVGVFGTDILPSRLPGVMPLAIYLRVFGMTKGEHDFKVTLANSDGSWEGEIVGKTIVTDDSTASIFPFAAMPVHIEKPGQIVANISIDGGKPVLAGGINVRHPIQPSVSPGQAFAT